MTKLLLGIDTGGTFTDFVVLHDGEIRVHKVLSSPTAPDQAIRKGIADLALNADIAAGNVIIVHGTTVATNATLEGKGVRTAYITNKGLKDVLLIGRQTRAELYNLQPKEKPSPLKEALMFEVDCRLDADGRVITPLTAAQLTTLVAEIDAAAPVSIAINLLFSFLDPRHEQTIADCFADNYFVSRSSDVLPEYREYERGITTWINAWIGPLINDYLTSLGASLAPSSLSIMQSSGLTIASDQAANKAVNLLLSGPAGGLAASLFIGHARKETQLMTFDMGGTSTDVALLSGGIRLTNQGKVAQFPVSVPMADIHTIGAGGGSIAFIDEGGLLQVGPASAGAVPGPACYGGGGTAATVTDANLVLGRLRENAFLGGRMALDRSAAEAAILPLAEQLAISVEAAALGIIRIANEHMIQALRVISIQRGFDPRDFTLTCFGGAGGLHFCDLAEALQMTQAILPVHSGVLSALGMLTTAPGRELSRTHQALLRSLEEATLERIFGELETRGRIELEAEGVDSIQAVRSLDLRYRGQTFTINVGFSKIDETERIFHQLHKRQYGHDLPREVELLNVRVHLEAKRPALSLPHLPGGAVTPQVASGRLSGYKRDVPIYDRATFRAGQQVAGPALITEQHSTALIKTGWDAVVDEVGNLRIRRLAT